MRFEIELKGRIRTVEVERRKGDPRFRVTVDGVAELVDARHVGPAGLSLIRADGSSHELWLFSDGQPGEVTVATGVSAYRAVLNGRRRPGDRSRGPASQGAATVQSPMPGKVVKVLVAPGDLVEARQGVIVVEAMKMENELTAPRAGRVKDVAVQEGASVEAGRVLVTLEPAASV